MSDPIPMLLFCPMCNARHVDEEEFAKKPHHTHACQNMKCGMVWRPAIEPTVGVWFLPGFNNAINKLDAWRDQQAPIGSVPQPLLYGVYLELDIERTVQKSQWGGAAHDDEHSLADWVTFVKKQLRRASRAATLKSAAAGSYGFRSAMIKVGALAVAAVESYDRKAKR